MTRTILLAAIAGLFPVTALAENDQAGASAPQHVKVARIASFKYGELYVNTKERKELAKLAQEWKQNTAWHTLTVEGHGYVDHDEEASITLGQLRAERVKALLVRFGVDPLFIRAVGHSRGEPGRYVDVTIAGCNDDCARPAVTATR